MTKTFNTAGSCRPARHYMVDLSSRLEQVTRMVNAGEYFAVNRARQYGKTTLLQALADYLKKDYIVVSMDFQYMSSMKFQTEQRFSAAFAQDFMRKFKTGNQKEEGVLAGLSESLKTGQEEFSLYELFQAISDICACADRPIVLMIDEVDTASNNQVFLDFLAQLRAYYLNRDIVPALHSVILAGVYDIRNLKRKIRPEDAHRQNSPWNIAADFNVDMSFSPADIAGMLKQYEADYHTGMDSKAIAAQIFHFTAGYPFLVSRICKLIDEQIAGTEHFPSKESAWTAAGVEEAVKRLLSEDNTLFESLIAKLNDWPEMKDMIYQLLFQGTPISYNPDDYAAGLLRMFGFAKDENGTLQIANCIFETRLYNYFLTLPEMQNTKLYKLSLQNQSQFVRGGRLGFPYESGRGSKKSFQSSNLQNFE